jgi:hypothetical protein
MKKIYAFKLPAILFLLTMIQPALAQDKKLLVDKPGTFKTKIGTLNGQGVDNYFKSCAHTDAEAEAAVKNILKVVDAFRLTPVLAEAKGFDGVCEIVGGSCNTKFGFGLPATVCFYFQTWSLRNGQETKHTVEPPQWRFDLNATNKFCSSGFNVSGFHNEYNATNPAYNEQKANKATVLLRELFFLPGAKEMVSHGIDRYGDHYVVFNPDRPPYWEQVTVREVFSLLKGYYEMEPNQASKETMLTMLENEFKVFSEAQMDGFAYIGNRESVFRIGAEKNTTPVMRPNPDYWNKNLPRSAIQFMLLEIPPKEEVKWKMDDRWRRQEGYYFVSRLLYELDVNSLVPYIE